MRVESTLRGTRLFRGARTLFLPRKNTATVFKLARLERSLLLALLPLFALASVGASVASILAGTAAWFERYQLMPMAFVFCGLFVWCAFTRSAHISRIRIATLIVGPGIVLERFLWGLLLLTTSKDANYDVLLGLGPWMILSACLYVALIPNRRAFFAGLGFYSIAAVSVIIFLIANPDLPDKYVEELMVSHIIAPPIFLIMMAVFVRLRLAYGTALDRAVNFESLAMQDQLTGLFNRRAFAASMRRARARQLRRGTPVSLIMCDIDHFKRINDTYGHDTGDNVLVEFSRILTDTMRRTDDVFRWGGEEFLILMEETNAQQACEVAERLRVLVEGSQIVTTGITSSFGVTELVSGEADTEFFNRVDNALYDAKEQGRNMVVMRKRALKRKSDPRVGPIADMIDSPDFNAD